MSDGSLSQDEIDALLQGSGGEPGGGAPAPAGGGPDYDAFKTLLDRVVGPQSSNLSGLMGDKSVTIGQPDVEGITADVLSSQLQEQVVQVSIGYNEAVSGQHSYILSSDDAARLAGQIAMQDQMEMNEMALEALKEALSTITGVALNTFGDEVGGTIMPDPAEGTQVASTDLNLPEGTFAKATYSIIIDGEDPIELVEVFDDGIVSSLSGANAAPEAAQDDPLAGMNMGGGGGMDALLGGGQPQQPMQQSGGGGMGQMGGGFDPGMMMGGQGQPNVQAVQFPSFGQTGQSGGESGNISLLMDVYMEMTVELGRTKKPIKEILGMGEGTIIELDKLAGEPVDILVNHKLIATGEVVVIDENFGVRVTEIVSPSERMKELT